MFPSFYLHLMNNYIYRLLYTGQKQSHGISDLIISLAHVIITNRNGIYNKILSDFWKNLHYLYRGQVVLITAIYFFYESNRCITNIIIFTITNIASLISHSLFHMLSLLFLQRPLMRKVSNYYCTVSFLSLVYWPLTTDYYL